MPCNLLTRKHSQWLNSETKTLKGCLNNQSAIMNGKDWNFEEHKQAISCSMLMFKMATDSFVTGRAKTQVMGHGSQITGSGVQLVGQ